MKNFPWGMANGIVLAAAMACASTAQAADDVLFSATAQITGLSYKLIDLTPNDGVAPSVTFNNSITLNTGNWDGNISYSNSLLPDSTLQTVYMGNVVEASPTGLSVSSTVTSQGLSSELSQLDPTLRGSQSFYSTSTFVSPSIVGGGDLGYVTLGANTAIVITGVASMNAEFNTTKTSDLINTLSPSGSTPLLSLYPSLNASIHLSLGTGEYLYGDSTYSMSDTSSHFSMDSSWWYDMSAAGDKATAGQQPFSIHYMNLADTEKSVSLSLDVSANSQLSGYVEFAPALPVDPVPGIPEPGTYALMGLGLAGIGLAHRRRKLGA